MSEINKISVNSKKMPVKVMVAIIVTALLLLIYGAGVIGLPISILYNYRDKNCDSVLSLSNIYVSAYPVFMQDETLSTPVGECTFYKTAVSNEEKGLWREAYDAYQVYSNTYPGGLYAGEAHEHAAIALINVAKGHVTEKQYIEALANLDLIVTKYADTSVSGDALNLFPTIYTSWETGLREAGEFERAEQVLNDFKIWVQTNQKTELELTVRNEFAQTYIAWGLALQSQKQYEVALVKLDMAVSLDPDGQSNSGSTLQAKGSRVNVYIDWGNDLLAQKNTAVAIEKFNLAVSLSDGDHVNDAKNALAKAYMQWASELSGTEDFEGALKQLDIARNTAATDAMKQTVDTAFSEVYLAFSNSTGPQARLAMKEALTTICKKHNVPDLPIFGLNKDVIHVGIYGVDAQLPESMAAKTPGEMHYVACVKEETQTIETRSQRVIILRTSNGYYYTITRQYRTQLIWNIVLQKIDSITSVAKRTFTGGTPPPFPEAGDVGGDYFYGPPPTGEELVQWFISIIK